MSLLHKSDNSLNTTLETMKKDLAISKWLVFLNLIGTIVILAMLLNLQV